MAKIHGLTPQQWRVAQLVAAGETAKGIAKSLHISPAAVESHIARVADAWEIDRNKSRRILIALRVRELPPAA